MHVPEKVLILRKLINKNQNNIRQMHGKVNTKPAYMKEKPGKMSLNKAVYFKLFVFLIKK
jgi:hypothetical protein